MDHKIILELSGANNPPKVFVDGKEVKVIKLEYYYETSSETSYSQNDFYIEIPNASDITIQKIGFKKP